MLITISVPVGELRAPGVAVVSGKTSTTVSRTVTQMDTLPVETVAAAAARRVGASAQVRQGHP